MHVRKIFKMKVRHRGCGQVIQSIRSLDLLHLHLSIFIHRFNPIQPRAGLHHPDYFFMTLSLLAGGQQGLMNGQCSYRRMGKKLLGPPSNGDGPVVCLTYSVPTFKDFIPLPINETESSLLQKAALERTHKAPLPTTDIERQFFPNFASSSENFFFQRSFDSMFHKSYDISQFPR